MGQDDDREKLAIRPRITTVDVRPKEVGETAAQILLHAIDGKDHESVVLQPKLVVRDSTCRI